MSSAGLHGQQCPLCGFEPAVHYFIFVLRRTSSHRKAQGPRPGNPDLTRLPAPQGSQTQHPLCRQVQVPKLGDLGPTGPLQSWASLGLTFVEKMPSVYTVFLNLPWNSVSRNSSHFLNQTIKIPAPLVFSDFSGISREISVVSRGRLPQVQTVGQLFIFAQVVPSAPWSSYSLRHGFVDSLLCK